MSWSYLIKVNLATKVLNIFTKPRIGVDRLVSVSLSLINENDISLNYHSQMQNDTDDEIGRSFFPFIYNCNRL